MVMLLLSIAAKAADVPKLKLSQVQEHLSQWCDHTHLVDLFAGVSTPQNTHTYTRAHAGWKLI